MHAFAGVFFQMRANDADLLGGEAAFGVADLKMAVVAERQIILADLIALRQVGIIIILAVPLRRRRDLAIERDGRLEPQRKASRFITGSEPGIPMHTGHVWVFGGAPNFVLQRQNNFVRVSNCTWTSKPMIVV